MMASKLIENGRDGVVSRTFMRPYVGGVSDNAVLFEHQLNNWHASSGSSADSAGENTVFLPVDCL